MRSSEAKYRLLFDGADVLVSVHDREGVCQLMNNKLAALLGGKPADFLGKPLSELYREQGPEFTRRIREGIDSGTTREYEDEVVFPGESRWLLSTVHPVRDAEGSKYAAQSVSQDITRRKQAEEALRQSESKMRSIFSATPIGIGLVSNRVLVDVNERVCEIVGYTADELIGQSARILYPSDEEFEFAGREKYRQIAESGICTVETRLKRKDGAIIDVLMSSTPLDQGNLAAGVTFTAMDITERKRSQEEKARLEAQLQQVQKMESVGRLAGGVAHDFNNMLGVILGHTEVALESLGASNPIHEDLRAIEEAAQRSADLTRQLLAFARRQTVTPRSLDMNDTVSGMLKMLRRMIGENIDLLWKPGADLWSVRMDPSQVDQVLANLCVNARDAIDGVGKVIIETENRNLDEAYCATHPGFIPGEYVRLSVSDDGCGMDAETLEQVFEPFFTTKDPGKGTGLGLATVYGIVKQNFGFVNVYSESGHGTTLGIYLPRHVGEADQSEEHDRPQEDHRGHETVLLVEDEASLLFLGKTMLQKFGYNVLSAGTPGEAIALAEKHGGEIDLLLTDVVMPEMNGRELAEQLLTPYPDMKCLFVSGYTADVIAHHGVVDAGVHFLQKPFSRNDLSAKVREALDEGGGSG
ncbi:MAG: PAS domain S-box protein [bacterium]|nr:PAS domain S-box protein [bacterium]